MFIAIYFIGFYKFKLINFFIKLHVTGVSYKMCLRFMFEKIDENQ